MALTKGVQRKSLSDIPGLYIDFAPQLDSTVVFQGGIVMLDSSGRARPGAAATGCIGVGVAVSNRDLDRYDNTVTGHADGFLTVRWQEGTFAFANGASADAFLSTTQPGKPVWISDDLTANLTNASGTRSVMGRFHHLDADGTVWVTMSKAIGAQLAAEMSVAGITALTDSSGGTPGNTLAAQSVTLAASACAGGATPTAAQVDTAIASLATALNAQLVIIRNDIASLAAKVNAIISNS